jgi:DNA polymerase III subunit alpha
MPKFVHLHNHTDFSLQDAAQSIDMMLDRVEELGMKSIAVTEHGNLFSMVPFYEKAKKRGIKPIIGCEMYISPGDHSERKRSIKTGKAYHHLVLLAQNQKGYQNLLKLVSIGYTEGFYYKPRVDKKHLEKYNEGIIATSACLAGEVNYYAARNDYETAKKVALEYASIFPDRFYLEVQNHTIPEELASHEILIKLSEELDLPMVATNDNHYARIEHSEAHDVLFCLGTGKDLDDPTRRKYIPEQFYIKSAEEMEALFGNFKGAIENSVKIAESCNVEIPMGKIYLPKFHIPKEFGAINDDEYLKILCDKGLKQQYGEVTQEIRERAEYELGVIKRMGFSSYFLIVQDFVQYAIQNKIPVGAGRGSGPSSIIAYATGITKIDPLKYNLLFERFLNPDRVSMPDFDIDFCVEGRGQVIDYIKDKYGHDSVAQIITFGTMKAKSVLRDVGRVMKVPLDEVDKIAKLVPDVLKITISKALKINKDFKKISEKNEQNKRLFKFSKVLEGLHRHASTHAAGVVIAPGPVTDYVPIYQPAGTTDRATQVDMNSLEDMGLIKMDFLGLRNLTVIDKAIKMIRENHNIEIDIDNLDLTNDKVFSLFAEGNTVGIFQFESEGMREHLKNLQPSKFEYLIAMNALYRPGPMANIPNYISRKHGKTKITYLHKLLEPILKETYGIIVYQEQVMQISQQVGGFTLAQGDMMRKAMGKKKADVMASFKVDFVEGAIQKSVDKKIATEIFDLLEKFAEYGFNKSHSTAYAYIAYQTAWLKVHYPAEFISANLSSEMADTSRVVHLLSDAEKFKIEVLPPDVNTSFADFRATKDGKISYGLTAIKNVGEKVSKSIAEYRAKNKEYKSIFDVTKVGSSVNRKVLESMIQAGACDSLVGHRAQLFDAVDIALKFGQKYVQEKDNNQASLFGGTVDEVVQYPKLEEIEPWAPEELLAKEKELIGFYLSGNPLEKYKNDLQEFCNVDPTNFTPEKLPEKIKFGGIISSVKILYDKRNRQWAIFSVAGEKGSADIFMFADAFEKYKDVIIEDRTVFVLGNKSNRTDSDQLKFVGEQAFPLEQARIRLSKAVNIKIPFDSTNENLLEKIKNIAGSNSGRCKLIIHLLSDDGGSQRFQAGKINVTSDHKFVAKLREIVGDKNAWIS